MRRSHKDVRVSSCWGERTCLHVWRLLNVVGDDGGLCVWVCSPMTQVVCGQGSAMSPERHPAASGLEIEFWIKLPPVSCSAERAPEPLSSPLESVSVWGGNILYLTRGVC